MDVGKNSTMLNKQFIINLIATVVAFSVNIAIGFFLTPFIVSRLGVEAYGFLGLANEFVGYAQVLTIALNSMAARYITIALHQGNNKDSLEYFSSIVIANVFISILLLIPSSLIIIFLDRLFNVPLDLLSDVSVLWSLVFATFFVSIIGTSFSVSTFACNRLDLTAVRKIESSILRVLILVIAFVAFAPKVSYLGLASLLSTVYVVFADVYYTKKLLPQIHFSYRFYDFRKIKILVSSGFWNSFTRLSSIFARGLDLLIVNIFVGAQAMGTLSVSRLLPAQILSLFAVVAGVFSPQLTIAFAKQNYTEMQDQIVSSVKILGLFSCIPMAILLAYGDVFYSLWMPSQDAVLLQKLSVLNCFAYVFALPLEGLWNVFTVANKVKQSSIFLFANSILSILTLLLALQFVEDAETKLLVIAGLSTIFSIIRALTFLPMYGAHCLKLKIGSFFPLILKNAVAVCLVTFVSFEIKRLGWISSWGTLVLAGVLTSLIALLINNLLVLNKNDRQLLINKVRKCTR